MSSLIFYYNYRQHLFQLYSEFQLLNKQQSESDAVQIFSCKKGEM